MRSSNGKDAISVAVEVTYSGHITDYNNGLFVINFVNIDAIFIKNTYLVKL